MEVAAAAAVTITEVAIVSLFFLFFYAVVAITGIITDVAVETVLSGLYSSFSAVAETAIMFLDAVANITSNNAILLSNT